MKIEQLAKALVNTQTHEEAAEKKEAARLKREPFKTNVEPFDASTYDNLKGWSEPKGAYILLEKKFYEYGMNMNGAIRYTLHTMTIGSRPDQIEKLRYNVQVKGMRILHWGKFPKVNDADPRQAALARSHVNPETGICAYDALEAAIRSHGANDTTKKDKEIDELKAKLAAATAKAEKAAKGDKAISA